VPAGCTTTPRIRAADDSASARIAEGAVPAAATITAGSLLGANPAKLEQWFGKPRLVRLDEPAEVWQYRGQGCVLDVYLYPGTGGMEVSHAEARSQKYAGDAIDPCLALLSQPRRKPVGS
jgi:hypothetical protein